MRLSMITERDVIEWIKANGLPSGLGIIGPAAAQFKLTAAETDADRVTIPPVSEPENLRRRYMNDPVFHAFVRHKIEEARQINSDRLRRLAVVWNKLNKFKAQAKVYRSGAGEQLLDEALAMLAEVYDSARMEGPP